MFFVFKIKIKNEKEMRKLFFICLILVVLAFFVSCDEAIKKPTSMPPLSVKVAQVNSKLLNDRIWFATTVIPFSSVIIEPRVNGYLQKINYVSGSFVQRGEVIFEIDPSQINTALYAAQAVLESAQASQLEAHNNYERALPLSKMGAISRSSMDEYTANYAAAKASVKSAEESLRSARLNSSYTTIKAPISGVIAVTPANVGDFVGTGTSYTTLTTISAADTMELTLAIPTSRYLKYRPRGGDNSTLLSDITLFLSDSTAYPHLAEYDYTEKDVSSGNSTVVIVAKIPNPDALLRSEMFARVRANIGDATECVVVPQQAVTQMQGVTSVWVIGADSVARFREVTTAGTYGDEWHIKSGLKSGELVATSAQLKLHEGAKVNPKIEK